MACMCGLRWDTKEEDPHTYANGSKAQDRDVASQGPIDSISVKSKGVTTTPTNPGLQCGKSHRHNNSYCCDAYRLENLGGYIETKIPMMKGLKFSEIQCAASHTGTLWGGDAE